MSFLLKYEAATLDFVKHRTTRRRRKEHTCSRYLRVLSAWMCHLMALKEVSDHRTDDLQDT